MFIVGRSYRIVERFRRIVDGPAVVDSWFQNTEGSCRGCGKAVIPGISMLGSLVFSIRPGIKALLCETSKPLSHCRHVFILLIPCVWSAFK